MCFLKDEEWVVTASVYMHYVVYLVLIIIVSVETKKNLHSLDMHSDIVLTNFVAFD